ncbi:hypothetical protein [Phaffia rhodozyma]|uniref:Uncharacterized protein n=1 Tax=Phaffia rhodozyma TaxID=264483 RepID=A0A0F7SXK7_PHARH|nr:hypothetical protein [Phaffia rhodozyma]
MSLSVKTRVSSPSFRESDQFYDLPSYSATALSIPSYSPDSSSSHIHQRLFAPKRSFGGLIKRLCSLQGRKQARARKEQVEELAEDEKEIAQKMVDQYWDKCISMGY